MSTGHLHLLKRSGRYWWRRRLPAPLSAALGIAQVRRSLRTAEPSIARRRARSAVYIEDQRDRRALPAPLTTLPAIPTSPLPHRRSLLNWRKPARRGAPALFHAS